jgi:hypothetical protein
MQHYFQGNSKFLQIEHRRTGFLATGADARPSSPVAVRKVSLHIRPRGVLSRIYPLFVGEENGVTQPLQFGGESGKHQGRKSQGVGQKKKTTEEHGPVTDVHRALLFAER